MGMIRILDRTGDRQVAWSEDDHDSIAAAQAVFEEHAHAAVAYARAPGAPAAAARPIVRFDPAAEEIIFTRPVTGG